MSWEQKVLGDISTSIQTGPFGSQLHQSDYSDEGVPVVMPKDLIQGVVSEESIARVSKEHVERLSKHKIRDGDILYSRRGDVGKCAFTSEREIGWICGTGCLKVSVDKDKADPQFIFYQLQKAETIGWVINHAVGSTMLNLNTSILSVVPVDVPEIEIQRKIVKILSSYDELIANNQKQIKLLEEAAQRLYKEWFVDLRFPGYENVKIVDGVPEGWELKPLSDIFKYVRGKSYTSKEIVELGGTLMVNLKNIKPFGSYNRNAEKRFAGNYKDSQKLNAGDLIMGVTDMTQERRLVGHIAIVPDMGETMTFSMDLIKLVPLSVKKSFIYATMYFGGFSKKISPLANGVNVLHLKPEAMMNMKMLIPTEEVIEQYDKIFEVYQKQMEVIQKQCDFATEARDRLLPKLMNGEIEV